MKWIEFAPDGTLKTPWGMGKWGDAATPKRPNTIFAEFIGQMHMLSFNGNAFESIRCSDGESVSGNLAPAGGASA